MALSFLVNFSIPYLVFEDYAGLNSKVGFIFGSIAFFALIFTYFFVPECKGKTLEEVDYLFKMGVGLRQFGNADTSGLMAGAEQPAKQVDAQEGDVEKAGASTASREDK